MTTRRRCTHPLKDLSGFSFEPGQLVIRCTIMTDIVPIYTNVNDVDRNHHLAELGPDTLMAVVEPWVITPNGKRMMLVHSEKGPGLVHRIFCCGVIKVP